MLLESVLLNYDALGPILSSIDELPLLSFTKSALKDVVDVLARLTSFIKKHEGDKYPTMQFVIPELNKLLVFLGRSLHENEAECSSIFRRNLVKYIKKKCVDRLKEYHFIANFMNPIGRNANFNEITGFSRETDSAKEEIQEVSLPFVLHGALGSYGTHFFSHDFFLRKKTFFLLAHTQILLALQTDLRSAANDVSEPPAQRRRIMVAAEMKDDDFLGGFPGVVVGQNAQNIANLNPWQIQEFQNYSQFNFTSIRDLKRYNNNPMLFWFENMNKFPCLFKIAKWIFAVPASSASSERIFSTAGNAYRENRCRLNEDTLSATVFLHDNRGKL